MRAMIQIRTVFAILLTGSILFSSCKKDRIETGFFDENVYYQPDTWREKQIEGWVAQYGKDFFKDLSIWDIDWHFDTEKE